MTADDTPLPITLPATEMTQLAALLTELGQFPRSSSLIREHLAAFLSHHGHVDADSSPTCSSMRSPSPPPACGTSPAARLGQPADARPAP